MDYTAKQRGDRVYQARFNQKYTIEEVANKTGIAPGILESIEIGNIELTQQQAEKLGPTLHVSARYLMVGMA